MSAAENPNLQVLPDPSRQLPPGDLDLAPKVAKIARWVGRMQARAGLFFSDGYRSARKGAFSLAQGARGRGVRMKQQNPAVILAGIAGTAFALGIATRIWRASR